MDRQIQEIQALATKYSKSDLGRMVQMGLLDPQKAMMAGMMIARIQQQNMQPPQTTVAEEVLGLPAVAPQQPQPQQAAPQGVAALPQQAPQAQGTGIDALPAGEVGNYAEGGIVAFADGGDIFDPVTGVQLYGAPPSDDYTMAERFGMLFDSGYKPYRAPVKPSATKEKEEAKKEEKPVTTKTDTAINPFAAREEAAPQERGLPPIAAPAPRAPALQAPEVDKTPFADRVKQYTPAVGKFDITKTETPEEAGNVIKEAYAREGYDPEMYNKIIKGIEAKKGDTATEKDRAVGEAIMLAGFKLMGARKGQEFQNLSEGAQEGLKTYQGTMKDLKARQEKYDERIEALRMADAQARRTGAESAIARADKLREQAANDRRELFKAENDATRAGVQAATTLTSADKQIAASIYGDQLRAQTSERVANLQAAVQRDYTAALKAQQLDATKAKILIDAAGDYIAKNAANPAYLRDPNKLREDAMSYAESIGSRMGVMPRGASPAPAPRTGGLQKDQQGNLVYVP